jgi:NADPH:quinone reductase-like Zn-dependent oxidoreductase
MGLLFGFKFGLTIPKNTLGSELAGEIEVVGKDVKLFKEVDLVFVSIGEVLVVMPSTYV